MEKRLACITWLWVCLFVLPGSALAHHGDADRYDEEVIVLEGVVVAVQMVNPHALIAFDVTAADGEVIRWQAELGGAQGLIRQFGWTRSTLTAGDKITLTGRRLKSGAPYMNLTERSNIVMTDTGQEIFRNRNYGLPLPTDQGQGRSTGPAAR